MERITTDEILTDLNPFGRVQVWFLLSSAYLQFFTSMNSQSINFVGATPDFHCSAREGFLLNESVPLVEDNNGELVFSQCQEYKDPGNSNATQDCQNGWTYSQQYYGKTIITEWDLVCGRDSAAEISQSLQQFGGMVGAIVFGMLADRYGRRPIFLASLILYIVAGISLCLSPTFAVFMIIKFFTGLSEMAAVVSFLSNNLEYMIPKYRNRALTIPMITFSFGLMFMALLAFLIRDWRYLQLATVSPMILATFVLWILPESLRWTMNTNKEERFKRLVQRLAKINNKSSAVEEILRKSSGVSVDGILTISGRNIPSHLISVSAQEHILESHVNNTKTTVQTVPSKVGMEVEDGDVKTQTRASPKPKKHRYLDLFKPPVLHVTIVISIIRFTLTFVYFGFALSTGRLSGNPYLNFFFSALVEVPARLLSPTLYRFTRRTYAICSCFAVCGIGLIAIIFVPDQTKNDVDLSTLRTILSLSGKFFITLSVGGVLLVTSELFPTNLRNTGSGFSESVGRFGAIIAPFALYLDIILYEYFSVTLMAVFALVNAVSVLSLPDTRRTAQPQTVAELNLMMTSRRKKSSVGIDNNAFVSQ